MITGRMFQRHIATCRTLILCSGVILACFGVATPTPELAGRWVRQLENGSWGDTLDLRTDGSVAGSVSEPLRQPVRWSVRTGVAGLVSLAWLTVLKGGAERFACEVR